MADTMNRSRTVEEIHLKDFIPSSAVSYTSSTLSNPVMAIKLWMFVILARTSRPPAFRADTKPETLYLLNRH